MRVRLDHVRADAVVGLLNDEHDVAGSVGGQLAVRLGGSISWNNSVPRITVVLLDSGEKYGLLGNREVEVAAEDVLP